MQSLENANADFCCLPGETRGIFHRGLETWFAHDAGLIHTTSRRTGEDLKAFTMTMDIVLWHDVRDVEVGSEAFV
jgi:hypothetical protein